ncbi:MAG TPA: PGPGW domain-containing protein [Solirubrobacteraceae bacterium]|nr:PGPGW domain-containing protein [Solirubrobacteraceae bacterium]
MAGEQQHEPDVPDLVRKMRAYKERHVQRPKPIRWLFVAVGFTVLLGGLAMLVLPGPALAVIPIGLFLLALEFQWAETWLERSIHQADRAKQRAAETSTLTRVVTVGGTVLAVAGFAAWALIGDIPVLPV